MNSTAKDLHQKDLGMHVTLECFQGIWQFSAYIDGIWILTPVAFVGAIVNAFMLYILYTKAALNTQINTMISAECFVRVLNFLVVFPYKAWILNISPMLGWSRLPETYHCYIGGLLPYLIGIAASIFNLLTNLLRVMFVRASLASNADQKTGKKYQKLLRIPNFHRYLLVTGLVIVAFHGLSTKFVEDDQFFFDQACLRPHDDLKPQTLGTKVHMLSVLTYNIISIALCMALIMEVKKEEKRQQDQSSDAFKKALAKMPKRKKKNFYTAGIGFAHVLVMLATLFVFILPMGIMQVMQVKITTSIQNFMMESIGYITYGLLSPGVIFWASSEAREPAKQSFKTLKHRLASLF